MFEAEGVGTMTESTNPNENTTTAIGNLSAIGVVRPEERRRRGPSERARPRFSSPALLGVLLMALMLVGGIAPSVAASGTASSPPIGSVGAAAADASDLAGWHTYPHLSILLPPGVSRPGTSGPHLQLLPKVSFVRAYTPPHVVEPMPSLPANGPVPPTSGPSPQILKNGSYGWNGVPSGAPNTCGCYPPDNGLGEGNGYVALSVNSYWMVWSTTGTLLLGQPLTTFYGIPSGTFVSDPETYYDTTDGHWFQTLINLANYPSCSPSCTVMLAVSATGDPTGTWYQYNVNDLSGILPDQPQLGTDSVAITFNVNDFGSGTAHLFVLNKSQAEAGTTPAEWDTVGPGNLGWGSMHPNRPESLTSTEVYFGDIFGGQSHVNLMGIQGAPPTIGKVTWLNLSTTEGSVGCIPAPGGGGQCQIDGRVLGEASYGTTLWAAATDGCSGVDCSHFWEVDLSTTPWSLVSDFTWNPPGGDASYYPNLAMDGGGSVGVAYSYSGSTDYPSFAVTGRSPSDPAGTLETPIDAKPGAAIGSAASRFGDYSGAAYDWATGTFWGSGEWIQGGAGSADWSTWVQSFTLGGFFVAGAATPNPVDIGVPVSFNGTAFGGSAPFTFSWVFGDGSSASALRNPVHTYSVAGTYGVHFWVNETGGLLRSRESNLTVVVNPDPVPSITAAPLPTDVGFPVVFHATTAGGTSPYAYAWAFGDGVKGAGSPTSHAYSVAGLYTARVWVNDSGGGSGTITTPVTVNALPAVSFTAVPVTSDAGTSVTFSATSSGGTGSLALTWVLGDGTGASGASLSHRYASRGNYTVRLWANDTLGASATASATLSVNPALTLLVVQATPVTLDVGRLVSFSESSWGGTPPYTYKWTFGDGSTSTASSPTHAYTAPGSYAVGFWLNDSGGGSDSAPLSVQVNPRLAITSFSGAWPGPATGTLDFGQNLALTAQVVGGTGTLGYTYTGLPEGCFTRDFASLFCTPTVTGNFTVELSVADQAGDSAFANLSVSVNSDPLVASFTAAPSTFTEGATTSITVVVVRGTPAYDYSYPSIPTGCTGGSGATWSCTPASPGFYTVEVKVVDQAGLSVFANTSMDVNPPLVASLTVTPGSLTQGSVASIQAAASGGTAPYTYSYTGLPSGCTISGSGGSCTPTSSGTFTVKVTVTDASGQQATASASLTVNAPATPFLGGLGELAGLGLLLAILIVVALVVLLWVRRRRRGAGGGATAPPPAPVAPYDPHQTAPSPEGYAFPTEPAPAPDSPPPPPPEAPAPSAPPAPP
jgi:PKD repeat protein